MNIKIIISIILILPTILLSQKEDYNWVFGSINIVNYDSTVNTWGEQAIPTQFTFKTDPPSFYQNSKITLDIDLTNANYSNIEGELLLYTSGMSIHGEDHQAIENGEIISFGPKWNEWTSENELGFEEPRGFPFHNGTVFLKAPDSEEIYLFYTNGDTKFPGFDNEQIRNKWYAKISIESDGTAKVTAKDKVIFNNSHTSGFLKCTLHANGRDWWLVQHRNDTLFTFLIDPSGIQLNHKQKIAFKMQAGKGGGSAYNPQGDQFALFQFSVDSLGSEFIIMDFDRCSGLVSNEQIQYRQDSLAFFTHGVEYSASGRYLYLCNNEKVFQFDTAADDIYASERTVMVWDSTVSLSPGVDDPLLGRPNTFGLMQRGPDDKIYISGGVQGNYIHVIHDPNLPGLACRGEVTAIRLNTHYFTTMPNFNTLRLGPLDGSDCDTLGLDNHPVSRFRFEQDSTDFLHIRFKDLSYYAPTSWSWDFGDGNSSAFRYPQHTYEKEGAYKVCQTVSNIFSSNTSCDTLYLGVSSLDKTDEERHITLFPNPTGDYVRVALHNYLPRAATIRFYNQQGQLEIRKALTGATTLVDMTSLEAGVYFYEVYDQHKRLSGSKVVKI